MKAYKLEIMVLDLEDVGEEQIKNMVQTIKYPNHCIAPKVKKIEARDIGEWHDDHPLNKSDTEEAEYQRLFWG